VGGFTSFTFIQTSRLNGDNCFCFRTFGDSSLDPKEWTKAGFACCLYGDFTKSVLLECMIYWLVVPSDYKTIFDSARRTCNHPPDLPDHLVAPSPPCNHNLGAAYSVRCKDEKKWLVRNINDSKTYAIGTELTNACLYNGNWVIEDWSVYECSVRLEHGGKKPALQSCLSSFSKTVNRSLILNAWY